MATLAAGSKPSELGGTTLGAKLFEHSKECISHQSVKSASSVGCPVCQMAANTENQATPVIEYKGGQVVKIAKSYSPSVCLTVAF